ncbi:hypothetical protein Gotur_017267 [Gossypium turneri]
MFKQFTGCGHCCQLELSSQSNILVTAMIPRGRPYRYPPGCNLPGPLQDAGTGQPMPPQRLATALANATPEQQRTMLGGYKDCNNSIDKFSIKHYIKLDPKSSNIA